MRVPIVVFNSRFYLVAINDNDLVIPPSACIGSTEYILIKRLLCSRLYRVRPLLRISCSAYPDRLLRCLGFLAARKSASHMVHR